MVCGTRHDSSLEMKPGLVVLEAKTSALLSQASMSILAVRLADKDPRTAAG